MEIIFLVSAGILFFYIWAEKTKWKDRFNKRRRKRAKQWKKKTGKQKYGK